MRRITLLLLNLFLLGLMLNAYQLVIYQNNLAMINRDLELNLSEGIQSYTVGEIPETILPQSVILSFPDDKIEIFDQVYNTSFRNKEEVLKNSINKDITIFNESGDRYSGTLVMFDQDFVTIKSDKNLEMINLENVSNIIVETDAKDSQLTWTLLADKESTVDCNLSFLCRQINWSANYNAVWDDKTKMLNFNGWTTLKNNTRFLFDEIGLNLFAGDLNLDSVQRNYSEKAGRSAISDFMPTAKVVSDFYLYDYPQQITINPYQEKNINFIESVSFPAESHYEYTTYSDKVENSIQFRNTEATGIGKPLPKGKVKVYSKLDGNLIFIGEDGIDHTAKDEKVSITNGYAFDLTAETVVEEQRKESNKVFEKDIKVIIKNRSSQTKTVSVIHNLSGYWDIPRSSINYQKRNSNEIEFITNINPDESIEVTWTEHIEY